MFDLVLGVTALALCAVSVREALEEAWDGRVGMALLTSLAASSLLFCGLAAMVSFFRKLT